MNNFFSLFKNKFYGYFLALFTVYFLPGFVFADVTPVNVILENPLDAASFEDLVEKIMSVIIQLGIPVVAIMIMYSGFLFIKAQGNKSQLEEAKKALGYALLGATIVLGAGTILSIIRSTVGDL